MKILFIIFGIISFILGAIGVVLPILPTTPFLLLSAFLFSKSSDRFHEYLIQTKLYQKYINEMVIERKTTRKKRNQSLFTVTLIFLIAVMITKRTIRTIASSASREPVIFFMTDFFSIIQHPLYVLFPLRVQGFFPV
mgnify:FL=1